ncbi:MAG TPA: heme-binding protein [Euryarchaeota archaeon]|nr:heme-binding protein [Euryarchaeota archaeon]
MVEKAQYSVIRKLGGAEVRKYPEIILATVSGLSDDEAFSKLFRYISGSNRASEEMDMTAPVISDDPKSEKIPMTAPVISKRNSFSFVLPSNFKEGKVPVPMDNDIEIERIPPRHVAVLRFRGKAKTEQTQEKIDELRLILKYNDLPESGGSFLMRYNPPITPGFMRKNEVGIEVRVD